MKIHHLLTYLIALFCIHISGNAQISNAVVEIYSGTSVVGIGFVWPDKYHVVTPLHVVAGRSNLKARSYAPGNKGLYPVNTVEKVLKKADLALLQLSVPLEVSPARISQEVPSVSRNYSMYRTTPGGAQVAGFHKKMENGIQTLDFYFGSRNPEKLAALRNQGYPQVSAKIGRVMSPVMPGDSGSPICNAQGDVVGIIDGGLYKGLRSYNWAIIASAHLGELISENNKETFASVKRTDPKLNLVTDNVEATTPLQFYNGKVSLQKIFTTTLGQINATLDLDQQEQYELEEDYAEIARSTGKYIKNAVIDVYQDWNTGATIAIPHGFTLEYSKSYDQFLFLQATSPSGKVKLVFAIIDETTSDPGHDLIYYILDMDYHAKWYQDGYYPYEDEEPIYATHEYYYTNDNGGDAAISLLYSYDHFMGLGAYIVSSYTTKEDEYYYELLQECVMLSDFPEY